jgi:hypothetical protein
MNGNESEERPFQLLELEHAKKAQLKISQPESSDASETPFELKELDTAENDLQLQKDNSSRNICKIGDLTPGKRVKYPLTCKKMFLNMHSKLMSDFLLKYT